MKKEEIPKNIEVLKNKVAVLIRVMNKTVEKLDKHIETNNMSCTGCVWIDRNRKPLETKPQEKCEHEWL